LNRANATGKTIRAIMSIRSARPRSLSNEHQRTNFLGEIEYFLMKVKFYRLGETKKIIFNLSKK